MRKFIIGAGGVFLLLVGHMVAGAEPALAQAIVDKSNAGRRMVPPRWYEKASGTRGITMKSISSWRPDIRSFPIRDEKLTTQKLDEIRAEGYSAIEIFAPAEGGKSYGGLDVKNHYRIDPEAGTMDDFRRLVRLIHSKGMAVFTFDNLGYISVDAPFFLKACDDVREGRNTKETKWFVWSASPDAPQPKGDSVFMLKGQAGAWVYSKRADRYYWSKWGGVDSAGNKVRLPQYNWESPEFLEEAERIVRFWMDTGIDGIAEDAVNWYPGYTWRNGLRRLTDIIASYGNTYSMAEGGGGFYEDPVAWITEGGYNSVEDYGLHCDWRKETRFISDAIAGKDARRIEEALRNYHDRVVAVGGVLYHAPLGYSGPRTEAKGGDRNRDTLIIALEAALGNMLAGVNGAGQVPDPEVQWLLRTKLAHPAMHNLSSRRKLPTNDDSKYYAFLRTATDGSERILAVFNFSGGDKTVEVDMSGVDTDSLADLRTGAAIPYENPLRVTLNPTVAYRLFQLKPANVGRQGK